MLDYLRKKYDLPVLEVKDFFGFPIICWICIFQIKEKKLLIEFCILHLKVVCKEKRGGVGKMAVAIEYGTLVIDVGFVFYFAVVFCQGISEQSPNF